MSRIFIILYSIFNNCSHLCEIEFTSIKVKIEIYEGKIEPLDGDISILKSWMKENSSGKIAKLISQKSDCFIGMNVNTFYSFFGAPNYQDSPNSKDYAFESNLWDEDSVYFGSSLSLIIRNEEIRGVLFINR